MPNDPQSDVRENPGGVSLTRVLIRVVLVAAGLWFLAALILPFFSNARPAARGHACKNKLKQIGLALQNYHDSYKCFPPAFIADADGKPMHSWRVLILPFL